MESLKEKLVDSETDLKDKKIVAINLSDTYPMGYIIVETGEFIAFVDYDSDGIEILSANEVYRKLYYNENLLAIFLEHGCISKEDYDKIYNLKEEEELKKIEFIKESEYKRYLELKAIYEKE